MTANPFAWTFRAQYLTGFVLCFGLIGYALYVQFGMLMLPCPLCILQRIAFAALGFVFLVGGLHAPKGRVGRAIYGLLAFVPAAAGAGITRLAAFVAEPYLRDGRLQAVFGADTAWRPEPMEVYFCVSDRRDFTAKIRALFEHLQAGIAPAWQV